MASSPWQSSLSGAVTQLMAARKGRMETMANHGSGWIRLEFVVPARGLIGFRTRFLTETRGTGIASSIADGYAPWQGTIEQRLTGSLVADRAGQATPYAMTNLQERGSFIVEPSSEVDECVEVTPEAVRVRKVVLDAQERFKIAARERRANR